MIGQNSGILAAECAPGITDVCSVYVAGKPELVDRRQIHALASRENVTPHKYQRGQYVDVQFPQDPPGENLATLRVEKFVRHRTSTSYEGEDIRIPSSVVGRRCLRSEGKTCSISPLNIAIAMTQISLIVR